MTVKELKDFLASIPDSTKINVEYFHYQNNTVELGHSKSSTFNDLNNIDLNLYRDDWNDIKNGDTIEVLEAYINCMFPSRYVITISEEGDITSECLFGRNHFYDKGPMRILTRNKVE